jgi:hypothetical protein
MSVSGEGTYQSKGTQTSATLPGPQDKIMSLGEEGKNNFNLTLSIFEKNGTSSGFNNGTYHDKNIYSYAKFDNVRFWNYSEWTSSTEAAAWVPPQVQDCYKTEAHSCRQCSDDHKENTMHFPDSELYTNIKQCKKVECGCHSCDTDFSFFEPPYTTAIACKQVECHQCSKCVMDSTLLLNDGDEYVRHWFPFLKQF